MFFFCQGGSWVSTGDGASRFARFAFRRHFFQHLGFRLVQSIADSPPIRLVGTPVFVLGVGVEGGYTVVITLFSSEFSSEEKLLKHFALLWKDLFNSPLQFEDHVKPIGH